jgi:hypothetical protein
MEKVLIRYSLYSHGGSKGNHIELQSLYFALDPLGGHSITRREGSCIFVTGMAKYIANQVLVPECFTVELQNNIYNVYSTSAIYRFKKPVIQISGIYGIIISMDLVYP